MEIENESKIWIFSLRPFVPFEDTTHMESTSEKEGIVIKKKDISNQQSFLKFVKKMSKKVISGGFNILDLTLPAVMLHKETNLECCLRGFNIATCYINQAALKEKDPIFRVQLILTGFIANMTTAARKMKAQPPIPSFIGETLQVKKNLKIYFF